MWHATKNIQRSKQFFIALSNDQSGFFYTIEAKQGGAIYIAQGNKVKLNQNIPPLQADSTSEANIIIK